MIKKKNVNIITLFVVCFALFYFLNITNSNSQQSKAISKKEAYKQQKLNIKKSRQKTTKQKSNNLSKKTQKKANNSKTVKKKNNKQQPKRQVKKTVKINQTTKQQEENKNNIKSDEIINTLIDKQIDFNYKKKINTNVKNKGVPSICIPSINTTPLQKAKQETDLERYKKYSKKSILSALKANNISEDLTNEIYKNLNHIAETTTIHNRHIRKTFDDFLDAYQIEKREKVAKLYKNNYKTELQDIEDIFFVDKEIILTLWGMETMFSSFIGSHEAFNALYSAGQNAESIARLEYFEQNLIMLAKLVDKGFFKKDVKSSFDGGLGGCQFMPDSFYRFAVSYNGGKPDIINNNLDVLASIANYLNISGWRFKEGVLTEVVLPKDFDICKTGFNTSKTIKEWKQLGVQLHPNGIGKSNAENEEQMVSILVADVDKADIPLQNKRAFFMYDNAKVILGYNKHENYCLTTGLLFELIKQS